MSCALASITSRRNHIYRAVNGSAPMNMYACTSHLDTVAHGFSGSVLRLFSSGAPIMT